MLMRHFIAALMTATALAGQATAPAAPDPSGAWDAQGDNGTHWILHLKVDGTKVEGTENEQKIQGSYENNVLTFAQPEDWKAFLDKTIGTAGPGSLYQGYNEAKLEADSRLHGTGYTYVRGYNVRKVVVWSAERLK
jgi:opacity protein-like surface antigen